MSDTSQAILLIADISGFTRFMRQKTISINHAKQIIVRLLKAVMRASKHPLKVAEIEGDAVFFYAVGKQKDVRAMAEDVKNQLAGFFSAFDRELHEIAGLKTCTCDACSQVPDLRLKQVVHLGEVAVERIGRFEKLYGLDVIVVHRMLKNSIEEKEYVMMTQPFFSVLDDFYGLSPIRLTESFEGVGDVEALVFYPKDLAQDLAIHERDVIKSSVVKKIAWRGTLSWKFLLDFLGLSRTNGKFTNLPV